MGLKATIEIEQNPGKYHAIAKDSNGAVIESASAENPSQALVLIALAENYRNYWNTA